LLFYWQFDKNLSLGGQIAAKTSLAVSSIEFCQAIFDEGNIG
jgi:hypothetical protein